MTTHRHQAAPEGASTAEHALGDRRAAILEAVVSEYIGTAQPVGSPHVAKAPGVHVSSATVRSEMVALEHEGYLSSPTPAPGASRPTRATGSSSTTWPSPGCSAPPSARRCSSFFDQVHGEMEEMLERTSGLLSELTSYAAVVVGPAHDTATVRSVQLVGLGPRLALLVVVLSDGAVEKRSIELDDEVTDDVLAESGALLGVHLVGRTTAASWLGAEQRECRRRPGGRTRPPPPSGSCEARSKPTTSSWAARPAWPRPSTRSRPCARCWASWSSSWWW